MYDSWRQADAFDSTAKIVDFPRARNRARRGYDVERINPFKFFELSQNLHTLDAFGPSTTLNEAFWACYAFKGNVDNLLKGQPIALRVSRASGEALLESINGIISRHFTRVDESGQSTWKIPEEGDAQVADWEWSFVKQSLSTFQTIFAEEMREAAIYRVPERGIFDTAKLVDSAASTFPPELLYVIPQKSIDDWCAAGRCLAFNLLSASGFHVARAVEATLEAYYQLATGKIKTLNGWNDYIKALEPLMGNANSIALRPTEKVLSALRQMKDDYRNPIVHPRVVLTEPDARMLFANGESLIIAMAQEIRTAQQATQSTGIAAVPS